MTMLAAADAIERFRSNEVLIDKFVNELGTYITTSGQPVKTLLTLAGDLQTWLNSYIANAEARIDQHFNFIFQGDWITSTSYVQSNLVLKDGVVYQCVVSHTSGTFATDLAAGKWIIFQGVPSSVQNDVNFLSSIAIGSNYKTVNTSASLISNKDFAGTVFLTSPVTLTDNLTMTCDLRPLKGAIITVASGKTLTLSVPPSAGRYQIFDGSGSIALPKGTDAFPEWFPYGTTTAAINKALQSLVGTGNVSLANYQTYTVNEPILPRQNCSIKASSGALIDSRTFNQSCISNSSALIRYFDMQNVELLGDSDSYPLINAPYGIYHCNFDKVIFTGPKWIKALDTGGNPISYNNLFNCIFRGTPTSPPIEILVSHGGYATVNFFMNAQFYNYAANVYTFSLTSASIDIIGGYMSGDKRFNISSSNIRMHHFHDEFINVASHDVLDGFSRIVERDNQYSSSIFGGNNSNHYPATYNNQQTIIETAEYISRKAWPSKNLIKNPEFYNNGDLWNKNGLVTSISANKYPLNCLTGSRILNVNILNSQNQNIISSPSIDLRSIIPGCFSRDNHLFVELYVLPPEGTSITNISIAIKNNVAATLAYTGSFTLIPGQWNTIRNNIRVDPTLLAAMASIFMSIMFTYSTPPASNETWGITQPALRLVSMLPFHYDFEKNYDYLSTPPTDDTFAVGKIFMNSAPSPGGYTGWICTTAGTPGTWKGFGLIEA